MLKQDLCRILVRPNSSETLPEFCHHPVVGVRADCLPSFHCSHKDHSFTMPQTVIMTLLTDGDILNLLFQGDRWWCHSMDCLDVNGPKWSLSCCNNLGQGLSLSIKTCYQLRRNGFSLTFVINCHWATHCMHSVIYPRSWIIWVTLPLLIQITEHKLSGHDVSILMNNDISTLQHFRTKSCERTVCMEQILDLWFSCFRSCYSFHSATNYASVNHNTSLHIAKTFVDASPWFFLSNKEFYHSKLYCTSLTDPIVRCCWSGTVSQTKIHQCDISYVPLRQWHTVQLPS